MAVLPLVSQLPRINSKSPSAGITILCKDAMEASQAVGPTVPHDVSLPSQLQIALVTSEMFHVPSAAFSFGALIGEDDLVAC